MVQSLRLCTHNAEGPGSSPGWGNRSHMLQLKNPVWCNEDWRSHMLQWRPGEAKKMSQERVCSLSAFHEDTPRKYSATGRGLSPGLHHAAPLILISRLQNLRNKKVKVAQLCPTLCDPMDYTVHGILQARILEWVAFFFSGGSSHPRDRIQVSHIAGKFFTSWAIREALRNKYLLFINLQPPPHPVCGTLL